MLNQGGVERALVLPRFSKPGTYSTPYSKSFEIISVFQYDDGYAVIRGDERGEYWEVISYSPQQKMLFVEIVSLSDELKKYHGLLGSDVFLTKVEKKQRQYILSGYVKGYEFKIEMVSAAQAML